MSYFGQGTAINVLCAESICAELKIKMNSPVLMLPFGKGIGWETRRLYFGLAVEEGILKDEALISASSTKDGALTVTRIFSFGNCNVACPYCKRDCQFIGDDGTPIIAESLPFSALLEMAEAAHSRGEVIRFSGGDPMMFPTVTMAIALYMWRVHGVKCSIAHNGSGTQWVSKIAPFLSSSAIDLKAVPQKMGIIMGIPSEVGEKFFEKSLDSQKTLADSGCLVDVRTPVFGDTSLEEMMFLASKISQNSVFWTWRIYKPVQGCDWIAPSKEHVIEMILKVSSAYPRLWMGMRAKWEKGGMVYFREGRCLNEEESSGINTEERSGSGNRALSAH